MFEQAIQNYLQQHGHTAVQLKSVLFDMDGVLFNSMPYHAKAWHDTMLQYGMNLSCEEAYMHEGRTGVSTINIVSVRERGKEATEGEIEEIYRTKSAEFNKYPKAERMPGVYEVMQKIKEDGLFSMLVTGSGQTSLLGRLDENFPGIFVPERMITAFDVKYGKPNPEPYLMALQKGKLQTYEAIVVENAPLGVQAGVTAGIFTVAVNTGPLPDKVLLAEGANLLFPSMQVFCDNWEELLKSFRTIRRS